MEGYALGNGIQGADPPGGAGVWSSGAPTPLSFTPPLVSAVHLPCAPPAAVSSPTSNNGFGAAVADGPHMIHVLGSATENVSAAHQASLTPLVSASASAAHRPTSQGPFPAASTLTSPSLAMTGWGGGGTGDSTDDPNTSFSGATTTSATDTGEDRGFEFDRAGRRHIARVVDPTEVPALKYTIAVSVTRDGKVVEEQLDPFELGRLYGQRQAALRKLRSRYDFLAVPEWVRLHPLLGTYFAELVGTFGWVLTLALVSVRNESIFNISDATSMTPLPIGFMFTSMIFTFGYISSSHFNPAVSIAVFLVRHMKVAQCCAYILCQLAGSLAAGVVAMIIQGNKDIFVPSVSTNYVSSGIFLELIFTFAMCLVVLNIAYSRQSGNFFYGFAVGMTISAGSASAGRISGGAFNPAAASGLQVAMCLAGRCDDLKSIWVYWLAPVVGAILAAILFSQMAQPAETQVLEDRKVFQNVNELHRQRMAAQAFAIRATAGTAAAKRCAGSADERKPASSSTSSERQPSSFSSDPRGAREMTEVPHTRTPRTCEGRDAEHVHASTQDGAEELDSGHTRLPLQALSRGEVKVATTSWEGPTFNRR
ncbi:aquaporin-like protein [Leishmania major strain Friedlin]|uniref:Aquaporin-like protein n=1 Tax=Leishmania major TaxID=5664 RepID=Q4Q537_LEIMA|nr:aquaporin-like protein [Leishmania major strain Friedlin]CAG9580373.1 aquaporin-like_protein [Leishmania major strain Friedlin]CAJ08765.1 aquaporin-like protein [Leishmania major strain Friedlin]|eukprot:XP_001685561.1 aquaporin-like protein [Leishmania major strain Friedlin]